MNDAPEEAIRRWGTRDVALWLQEVGFPECVKDFRGNKIDGPALLNMNPNALRIYPSLSDATKREKLKASIARLPGSTLAKGSLNRKISRGDKKKKAVLSREESMSPPPLPERPQPNVHHHQQQYADQDEEDSFDDEDDSFDSDSDFYDEGQEDTGATNNNNDTSAHLAPPEQAAPQSRDSIRKIQAKFMAFGLRGMDNQQLSATEEQYLEEEEEDDQDVYDVPPEFQHQYYYPPEEDDDDGDIYDVPPEESQGHCPPASTATQVPHQLPPRNYPSSPQPVAKLPQLRAPIKQMDKPAGTVGAQHDPHTAPSSLSDKRKAFENNTSDTSKNMPGKLGKQFGNLAPSNQSTKVDNQSSNLPSKFPTSPQLPPKNPNMFNSTVTKSHDHSTAQDDNDGDNEKALSNMPAHLRDRFRKSKEQSKQRKMSLGQENAPQRPEVKDPTTALPSQQKSIANSPFLQKQLPPSPKDNIKPEEMTSKPINRVKEAQERLNTSSAPDSTAKSIKDRMKMFSNSDDPAPPVSPGAQKWLPSNERKPALPGKPPVEDAKPSKMLPPRTGPESKKAFIPNGKEPSAVPPLPDRNTKPAKFSGSRSSDINKRPPMPLPPASYDDEENYDPPIVHEPVIEENYDPPRNHGEEIMEENYDPPQTHEDIIEEDTYDPPPMPTRMPASTGFGGFKPPRFPPKEDKRVTEPDLPPRPPKSNNVVKGPTFGGGRRNTFTPSNAKPPAVKPEAKVPPRSASPNPLESYPWYRGEIDRRATESALERDKIDGCFIVRDPSKADEKKLGYYSLSIWHCGRTRHLRIRCRPDKKYVVGESKEDERPFDSVAELIKFHKKNPLLLKSGGSTLLTCLPSGLA